MSANDIKEIKNCFKRVSLMMGPAENQKGLIFREDAYAITGAAMEVHNTLGCGFLEGVYQEALEIEFGARGIPYVSQKELVVCYKGQAIQKAYKIDFLVYDQIIVVIKALAALTTLDDAQIINYLKASNLKLGILINFGSERLEWKRKVLTRSSFISPSFHS